MDPRERWQTLQGRLTAARYAVDDGDLATAMREVTAALELDPDFLAAQALRDRILKMSAAPVAHARGRRQPALAKPAPPPSVPVSPVHTAPVRVAPVESAAVPAPPAQVASAPDDARPAAAATVAAAPVVSAPIVTEPVEPVVVAASTSQAAEGPTEMPAGYVKFEQRARRRRVDRRIDAAREAIERRRIRAAAAALDEVIDLDPNQPELAELTARFDELRRQNVAPHRGPWVFAVAVFAAAMFGASWIQDASPRILSRQMVWAAPLVAEIAPAFTIAQRLAAVIDAPAEPAPEPEPATSNLPSRLRVPDAPAPALAPAPAPPAVVRAAVPAPAIRAAATVDAPPAVDALNVARATREASATAPIPPPTPAPVRAVVTTPAPPLNSASAPASTTTAETTDDGGLVRRALQRYRHAYEGLDARSAQEVWPAVNQTALARAFDGLQSQSLTFDACDVNLRGEAATATCRGSARYVPKVGSRDPRVESLVWNFKLHKTGSDWLIDSARAER